MKPLILVSHGRLCEELKKSIEMIMGPQENIYTVPLLPEEGQQAFVKKFKEVSSELSNFTVIADLYGGTPANALAKVIMSGEQTFPLYTGMNMAMVIDFLNSSMLDQEPNIVSQGKNGIVDVTKALADLPH